MIAVMIMVTVLLISLTAALPSIYQEGQRQREEELIFRAEQYARAIYLFHATLGRYPTSVKELLNTNGVRFLRQPYRDPVAPNGRWRFIHANAAGMLIDSFTQNQPVTELSTSPDSNAAVTKADERRRKQAEAQCNSQQSSGSDATYQTGQLLGAFIAGVAPCSNRQSIRVLNKEDHYDDWEFLALKYVQYGLPSPQTPPGQPGMMSQPFGPGGSNSLGAPNQPQGPAAPGNSFQSGPQQNSPIEN
ncbi:MAG: hypothetical protein ACRD1J_11720 [Terriglobia bacterium]